MKECTGEAKEKEGEFDEMANSGGMAQKDSIFIRLLVLREVSLVNVCVCVCVCVHVCVCVLVLAELKLLVTIQQVPVT